MQITQDHILKALSTVQEPDLKKDLVTLNMIRDIQVDGSRISFTVVLTTPACPLKEQIKNSCIEAIHTHVSDQVQVAVNMTADVTGRADNTPVLPKVKNIVAVGSGKGGVGKSTVTANLAVALASQGAKVGIIDADIFGPSIPTMFNAEGAKPGIAKVGDKNFLLPVEQYGIKLLSIGFLAPGEDAIVWRGPMASSALKQFITDTLWEELDYLLIDLPPGTSDIHLTLVGTVPLTGAVIVTTPQKVALADATKAISMFRNKQINVPILGVVENMAYFSPAELSENKYYIFGKDGGKVLAQRYEVPFLGEVPIVQSVRESGDKGKPVTLTDDLTATVFQKIAQELARNIALRNAHVTEEPQTV